MTDRTPITPAALVDAACDDGSELNDGLDAYVSHTYNAETGLLTFTFERASEDENEYGDDWGNAEHRFQLVGQPQPATVGVPELWAVYVSGMDDYHACASRRLAARNATWGNLGMASALAKLDDKVYPLAYQYPVPWPGTAEDHASALAALESGDPRWSDPAAPVLGELARHLGRRLLV